MYWRRASIQDRQASTSAWWRHCSETVFRDNFVTFRRRSKRIAFLESVNFSTCVCMQIFNFRNGYVTTFRHHSGAYISSANAWSQTLQTSKRHTFRVSAFYRFHWFGRTTVSCRLCAGQSKGTLKTRKMLFLIWLRPCYKNSGIYHDSTRPRFHSDGLPPKSRRSVVSI